MNSVMHSTRLTEMSVARWT